MPDTRSVLDDSAKLQSNIVKYYLFYNDFFLSTVSVHGDIGMFTVCEILRV